ncbi:MAG: type II secretion system protein [Vulcanimicrobiota bacterium]
MNKNKGFTLIELMIVIAIISILASIIIPNIKRARARAQLTACMENLKSLATAGQMFLADAGSLQRSSYGSITASTYYDDDDPANGKYALIPNYISAKPVCPAGGEPSECFVYQDQEAQNVLACCNDFSPSPHRDITGADWCVAYRIRISEEYGDYSGFCNIGGDTNRDWE